MLPIVTRGRCGISQESVFWRKCLGWILGGWLTLIADINKLGESFLFWFISEEVYQLMIKWSYFIVQEAGWMHGSQCIGWFHSIIVKVKKHFFICLAGASDYCIICDNAVFILIHCTTLLEWKDWKAKLKLPNIFDGLDRIVHDHEWYTNAPVENKQQSWSHKKAMRRNYGQLMQI